MKGVLLRDVLRVSPNDPPLLEAQTSLEALDEALDRAWQEKSQCVHMF